MKARQDERDLLASIQGKAEGETVREVIARTDIAPKRAWYLLEKWGSRRWYDWGVTVDLGWLTDEGRAAVIA